MAGLRWTYQQLTQYFAYYERTTFNPLIEKLLSACAGSSVYNIGGHSVILQVSPSIVAKVPLEPGDTRLQNEQQILDLLEKAGSQHTVKCFFLGKDICFLELRAFGTLYDRMSFVNRPKPLKQWMLELVSAAACLEELGYAHGDIRPQNIMVDGNDHLKLIDFDHSLPIGGNLEVGQRAEGGSFGVVGPVTEQFAIGSVFWFLTRGSGLYAELEGPEQVERLLDGIFPPTDPDDPIDRIIAKCWNAQYSRVADLNDEVKFIVGQTSPEPEIVSSNEIDEEIRLCKEHYSSIVPSSNNLKTTNGSS